MTNKMFPSLATITLTGYKSIGRAQLGLQRLNVLIGANGAGKSNLISFFGLLRGIVDQRLQVYTGVVGGASSLLYYGAKRTPRFAAELEFETESGNLDYFIKLRHTAGDRLVYEAESVRARSRGNERLGNRKSLGAGHRESRLAEAAEEGDAAAETVRDFLQQCCVYQFHDTSATAGIKQTTYVHDNKSLQHDASNLAAVLYKLKKTRENVYRRIVQTVRQIAPWFGNFVLEPSELDPNSIFLNWRESQGVSQDLPVFGSHQLSDGTLRAIALITLLQQPEEDLPALIVIDEPELGLHPTAIVVLGALLKKASYHCQVIVATQSTFLLDQFELEDVVVVDRDGPESEFKRLDSTRLEEWLSEYSLSELWEKNVLGGGPA